MDYLFCFLRPDKRSNAKNQWRAVALCQRDGCGYLDESEEKPKCSCKPDPDYFLAFTTANNKKRKQAKEEEENGE